MPRKVALVAVGVNRTKVLADLRGAASGAEVLAHWFRAQERFGVEVTVEVLVDESADGSTRPVKVRDVQDAVARLVDDGSYDLLALYLAGHGIVKSGTDEQVLLSEVHTYPQEAISVVATAQAARFCGMSHFVIISDACRNAVDPFSQLGSIAGVPVVRRKGVVGVKPTQVDLFYATEPSQTAKEFYGEGFFTKILCRALEQAPVQICQAWEEHAPNRVIDGWLLGEYLRDQVPREAASATPAFDQTPDAIILSRAPLFLGYAPPGEPGPVSRPTEESVELSSVSADVHAGSIVISGDFNRVSISVGAGHAWPSIRLDPDDPPPDPNPSSDDTGGGESSEPAAAPDAVPAPPYLLFDRSNVRGIVLDVLDPLALGAGQEPTPHPEEAGGAFPVEEVWGDATVELGTDSKRSRGLGHLVPHALGDAMPFGDRYAALQRVLWRVGHPEYAGSVARENAALDASGLGARVASYLARLANKTGRQDRRLRERGIWVVGAEVSRVFVGEHDPSVGPGQSDGVRAEDVAGPYRVLPKGFFPRDAFRPSAHTVIVELNAATAVPLPVIQGHTVTACVVDGMVQDVIIEPSTPSHRKKGRKHATLLQWRRAVMASLAAAGKLHLVGELNSTDMYRAVRHAGLVDPTLALYAAYGCALAGSDINFGFLFGSADVAMFDFAVLSRDYPRQAYALAPFCPSLSLGWSFLAGLVPPSNMPQALADAAPLRLNAEWTTFRSADIAPLLELLHFREVK